MFFIGDFHIHTKYSRATSPKIDLESLDQVGKTKGIQVLGAADFTHPVWFKNLKKKLKPAELGLYTLRNNSRGTRFLLTSEISCIYSKNNKVRKNHIIIFAPSLEVVEKINKALAKIGNLQADGRPILKLEVKELVKIILNISSDCLIVPAHIWTPWFSLFGSKSGFNSLKECFQEYSQYIYAVETGLSSDPLMNWRISELDNITLISNSDAHSLSKIGREANVFNTSFDYYSICKAIKNKELEYTIEFFPEEGKYHYNGHRKCKVSLNPKESNKINNICPKCKKPLTIGVLARVEELADREEGYLPKNRVPYKSLLPLSEIIAYVFKVNPLSLKVKKEYQKLINYTSEFELLLNTEKKELEKITSSEIATAIIKTRRQKIKLIPGYDGLYGNFQIL